MCIAFDISYLEQLMLFDHTYKSIDHGSEILYKSKGSKFYAYSFPVMNESEVKHHLQELKLKYPDATHHCYAYVLNPDKSAFRSNDDGEPSGTAGKPILRQIQKLELTNTLVVVVRYFGGTMLGVPGLIEAYGESAAECLQKCNISTHEITEKYLLECPFGEENNIYRLCKQFGLSPMMKPDASCFSAEIEIPLHKTGPFKQALKDFYQISIQYIGVG